MKEENKAIEIVKSMIADGIVSQEVAERYFPELAESEDERIRKALIRFHKSTIDVDGIKGDDIIAWLEKQGEKKPVEWSEDDEAARKDIIDKLERIKMTIVGSECKICQKEIDWLKSLRPQNHWKPTEEQLTCLEDAVNSYHKDGYPAKYLTSLLDELKAL